MDKKLRKAYFGGQLPKYLDGLLANGANEEEIKALEPQLEELQKERDAMQQRVRTFDLKDTISLPGVDELMALSEAKNEALERWEAERESDYQKAREIFSQARNADLRANRDQYLDWGFELAQLQYNLDLFRVWKDQLYRARLVRIMDGYGCSRAEAEERAKLTPEYREYKTAVLFRDLVEEVIMLCKKKYSL